MARPKKRPIHPKEAALFEAYEETCQDLLPERDDLLSAIVAALLARIRRRDEREADQIMILIRAMTARAAYFKKQRVEEKHGWASSYADLLREIVQRSTTRSTHCRETVIDQGVLLDRYLEEHPAFLRLNNTVTRIEWIEKHAPAVNELLIAFPCFCKYDADMFIETKWDERGLREVLAKQKWLNGFTKSRLTAAKLRDAFIAMLHGTRIDEIVQIRKKPGLLITEAPSCGYEDDKWLWFGLTGQNPHLRS